MPPAPEDLPLVPLPPMRITESSVRGIGALRRKNPVAAAREEQYWNALQAVDVFWRYEIGACWCIGCDATKTPG